MQIIVLSVNTAKYSSGGQQIIGMYIFYYFPKRSKQIIRYSTITMRLREKNDTISLNSSKKLKLESLYIYYIIDISLNKRQVLRVFGIHQFVVEKYPPRVSLNLYTAHKEIQNSLWNVNKVRDQDLV